MFSVGFTRLKCLKPTFHLRHLSALHWQIKPAPAATPSGISLWKTHTPAHSHDRSDEHPDAPKAVEFSTARSMLAWYRIVDVTNEAMKGKASGGEILVVATHPLFDLLARACPWDKWCQERTCS